MPNLIFNVWSPFLNMDSLIFELIFELHRFYKEPWLMVCNFICLFVLRLNVPVNTFLVMSGRSQRFPCLTSTVGSKCSVSCSRTQHGDACGDRTQDISIRSPTLYHYATALPLKRITIFLLRLKIWYLN